MSNQIDLPARLRWIAHGLTGRMVAKGSEIAFYEEHERLVWPFATQGDFDEARRHPKLLFGAHQ